MASKAKKTVKQTGANTKLGKASPRKARTQEGQAKTMVTAKTKVRPAKAKKATRGQSKVENKVAKSVLSSSRNTSAKIAKAVAVKSRNSASVFVPLKRLAGRLTRIPRYVFFWIIIIGSIGVVYQFSAQTSGGFSNEDLYQIMFDHTPKTDELDEVIAEASGIYPVDKEVVDGNILQFRTPRQDLNDPRQEFAEKLAGREDILSVGAYRVYPISPSARYLLSTVLSVIAALAISFLGVMYHFRRDLATGLKVFSALWIPLLTLGSMLAALGIGISYTGVIEYSKETFDLYVIANAFTLVATLFLLINPNTRKSLINLLFTK